MKQLLFLLLPTLLLAGDGPSLNETIESYHIKYIESLKKGDIEAHLDLFTDDAFVLNPGMPIIRGKDSIRKDRKKVFASVKVLEGVIKTITLEQSGFLAYEVGEFSYTIRVGDSPARIVGGHYVAIWKKQADGSWRYQLDAGLPN